MTRTVKEWIGKTPNTAARKLMPSYSGYFSYILDEMDDVIAKADKIVAQGGEAHGGVNVG